jgi:AcrR family transcriptional regulator
MGRKPFVRDRILNAAFDLFALRGYEAVSTREIAAKAEVGPASMFKVFPTKEQLGRELYALALAPIAREFAALVATGPAPAEALTATVEILYRMYDQRPRALALLIFPPHDFTPWEVDRDNPEAVRALIQRLAALDDDGAAVLWGALTGPLADRYLRRRDGAMSPFAPAHARRILPLLQPSMEPLP